MQQKKNPKKDPLNNTIANCIIFSVKWMNNHKSSAYIIMLITIKMYDGGSAVNSVRINDERNVQDSVKCYSLWTVNNDTSNLYQEKLTFYPISISFNST